MAGTDLLANSGAWWWPGFSVIQWLALLAAVAGLGWLAALAILGYFQLAVPPAPKIEGWPVPTLLAAAGVTVGIVLALVGKVVAAAGARGRAALARKRLRQSIADSAANLVVEPAEAEIARYRSFRKALADALA